MKVFQQEFPFAELRTPTGDYYESTTQMIRAGFENSQMWSVVTAEGDDGFEYYVYGPANHYVNKIGYIATAEHHDGDTYYEEIGKECEHEYEFYPAEYESLSGRATVEQYPAQLICETCGDVAEFNSDMETI